MYYFVKNFYFVKILICRAIYSLEDSSEKTLDLFLDVFSGHLMMLIVPKRFLRSPFPSSSNKCSLKKKKKRTKLRIIQPQNSKQHQNLMPLNTQIMPSSLPYLKMKDVYNWCQTIFLFTPLTKNVLPLMRQRISYFYPLQISTQCNLNSGTY